MDLNLTGKVAIITGGSDGIGRAKDTGMAVLAVRGDVRSDEDVANVVEKTLESYSGIDILFNNAGSSNAYPFLEVGDEVWREDLDVKVYGAIRFSRAVIPHMKQRGGGRIINVTTIGGKAPAARSLPTSVSRAAGINFSKSLAGEFAADGILVNSICLGLVKSAYFEALHREEGAQVTLEAWYERMGPVGACWATG